MARNSANGYPTRGVPIKGISGKRSIMGGEVLERQAGLLEGPGVVLLLRFGCSSDGWGIFAKSHSGL